MFTEGRSCSLQLSAVIACGASVIILAGCGGQDDSPSSPDGSFSESSSADNTREAVKTAEANATMTDALGQPVKTGPPPQVTVDGQRLEIELPTMCQYVVPYDPPAFEITTPPQTLEDAADTSKKSVTLSFYEGRPTEIRRVSFGGGDTFYEALMAIHPSDPPIHGFATSTTSGDTYTITGEAWDHHSDEALHPFEIVASCG